MTVVAILHDLVLKISMWKLRWNLWYCNSHLLIFPEFRLAACQFHLGYLLQHEYFKSYF